MRLEDLISPSYNYKQLRYSNQTSNTPFIPLYLTDLTFIVEGNPHPNNEVWNIRCFTLQYETISQLLAKAEYVYPFSKIPQINNLLCNIESSNDLLTERERYDISLLLEPRWQ